MTKKLTPKEKLCQDIYVMLGLEHRTLNLSHWNSITQFNISYFNPSRRNRPWPGTWRTPTHEELRLWVARCRLLGIEITGWDDHE